MGFSPLPILQLEVQDYVTGSLLEVVKWEVGKQVTLVYKEVE